jgi:RNA polymerase sigma-70 factor (ECF subfamily)
LDKPILPDLELVEGCLKGQSSAQYGLYQRYGSFTFGICRRYTSDKMEAEDLHQVGWMRVFDKLKLFRNDGPFGAWIRQLFVSVCLNAYQKRKSRLKWFAVSAEDDTAASVADPAPPSDFLELEKLAQLISQLPEGPRLVFNLFAVEGMNHKEIALSLDISEETSRQQLRRARITLSRQICGTTDSTHTSLPHYNNRKP